MNCLFFRKDARLPEQLQRAMAAEAEASREARAKVIAADGEMRASKALREASMIIEQSPAALQLRYLQVGSWNEEYSRINVRIADFELNLVREELNDRVSTAAGHDLHVQQREEEELRHQGNKMWEGLKSFHLFRWERIRVSSNINCHSKVQVLIEYIYGLLWFLGTKGRSWCH